MMGKPTVVVLCGSTKFKQEFLKAQEDLTLKGEIVISVGFFDHADKWHFSPGQKAELDELHLRKIDLSDGIFVINVGGYIGESTSSEIKYSKQAGKKITYLEPSK